MNHFRLLSTLIRRGVISLGCVVPALVTTLSNAALPDYSILTIGDSITLGYKENSQGVRYDVLNPANEGNGVRIGGYQPELEEIFNRYNSDTRVYNWGIGGDTSTQVVNRIDGVLNSRFADYILLMVGTNDQVLVSLTTFKFNIETMIDKARNKGVTPILATITYRNDFKISFVLDRNELITGPTGIASSKNVILADQFAATEPPNWAIADSGDGLHVGFEGDRILAETWFTAITGLPPRVNITGAIQLLLE